MYSPTVRQPQGLAGFFDWLKDAGGDVVDVIGDVWTGTGDSDSGLRDVISGGIEAAIDVIRRGSAQEVAQVLTQNLSPEMRAELERAYAERRARELGGQAARYLPYIIGGVALLMLLRKRR